MMNEPLSSIMTKDLITIGPKDTLEQADMLLRTKRIHHLPVVDGNKLVGLVTTYDLYKNKHSKSDYPNVIVETIMTTKLATLEPIDKVGTAAEIFLAHLFHAIPIVADGELAGIVTTHDVLKYCFRKEYKGDPWTS
ncbi:MAG: CBS domain-containing protein [Saprospiraceae bacterium]|nr:CBS domain-containing protein [Saprospiraceae bacterium]